MAASRPSTNRSAQKTVRRLLPADGDFDRFIDALVAHRGRPIKIMPCDLSSDDPSGLWVPLPDKDLIFHAREITRQHRAFVVCHEAAHMLLHHESQVGPLDVAIIGAAFDSSIDPAVAVGFFARHRYEQDQESEAEALATDIWTELSRRAADEAATAVLSRDNISTRLR